MKKIYHPFWHVPQSLKWTTLKNTVYQ